jgi:hypothetical protein
VFSVILAVFAAVSPHLVEASDRSETDSRFRETNSSGSKNMFWIEGTILNRYIFDSLINNSGGRTGDKNDESFLEVYSNSKLHFNDNLLLHTNLALRQVSEREDGGGESYLPRKHYFLKGYGIVAEELSLEYREERFLMGMGKFNPTFGYALNSRYYGVGGTKIINSYQLSEKLGFYVAMVTPIANARINFFRNDSTFLSRSLLNDRGAYSLDKDMGNVSNILDNFSITLDFITDNNYRFDLGFRKLATDDPNKKSEFGIVMGMECLFEETLETLGVAPAMEFVLLGNSDGEPEKLTGFTLVNIPIFYDRWNFGISWSAKISKYEKIKFSNIAQVSVGYTFQNGLSVDFSRKYENDYRSISVGKVENEKFSSWGIGLSYMLKFE